MTRGLAASEEYIFVGYSSQNERKLRYWKTGGIWVVDRKSLKTVEKILLPGAGDVHEIRIVGSPDDCHNGHVMTVDDLEAIRNTSPLIDLSYQLRRSYPILRRDLFPFSQLVRGAQMTARWKKSLRMRLNIAS